MEVKNSIGSTHIGQGTAVISNLTLGTAGILPFCLTPFVVELVWLLIQF